MQRHPHVRGVVGLHLLASIATLAAIAALVLGVVAVGKSPQVQSAPTQAPVPGPSAPILFDDASDRALCEALPDLMRERNTADTVFQALPPAGSPERNAAIPAYKSGVQDWAQRTQDVLAAHAHT